MAKTPKVKKRAVSIRSRTARRGASPTKDLAVKAAPVEESDYKPWLHNAQSAGISKRKKVKTLTRQQRVRQQRGLEKADAIVSKHEKKLADSKSRARKIDERRADWVDLNEAIGVVGKVEGKAAGKKAEVGQVKGIAKLVKPTEGVVLASDADMAEEVPAQVSAGADVDATT